MASIWCECPSCRDSRARFEYTPAGEAFEPAPSPVNPFRQAVSDMFDSLAQAKPLPFQPEPQAETVYTHVLLDYNSDGTAEPFMSELHTPESLLEAIASRYDDGCRYRVFELGRSILDVAGE